MNSRIRGLFGCLSVCSLSRLLDGIKEWKIELKRMNYQGNEWTVSASFVLANKKWQQPSSLSFELANKHAFAVSFLVNKRKQNKTSQSITDLESKTNTFLPTCLQALWRPSAREKKALSNTLKPFKKWLLLNIYYFCPKEQPQQVSPVSVL